MLKQYDPQTAKQTILKRTPPDEFPVSQRVLDGIAKLFGECFEHFGAARAERHFRAFFDELQNRRAADAFGAAGDGDNFVC